MYIKSYACFINEYHAEATQEKVMDFLYAYKTVRYASQPMEPDKALGMIASHHPATPHTKLIEDWVRRDTKTVYRAIDLSDENMAYAHYFSGVGRYWTHDMNSATPYFSDGVSDGNIFVLEARVELGDIDWKDTLYKSSYHLSGEKEIYLNATATPTVTKVYLLENNLIGNGVRLTDLKVPGGINVKV
jgi:hypothetical protein